MDGIAECHFMKKLVFDTIRRFWTIKPVTKIKKSNRLYNRKKNKKIRREEYH